MNDLPAFLLRTLRADADLIFDGSIALEIGGIAGVNSDSGHGWLGVSGDPEPAGFASSIEWKSRSAARLARKRTIAIKRGSRFDVTFLDLARKI
ncbi:hypothetical protein [Novosphingobium sp. CF614]|uniref:hypothetical protein n=1 Tax=Novosphingobium sp. CF614 TaxID=1884364 RepID=UPI0015A5CF46|nr:hypothetical protein [Novosphingobium sp. CF614]